MNATRQSGFGVVAIIIAILVVVALGYVGYRVYTANTNKPASTNNTATNNQTGNNTQDSNTQNNGMQDTATYLDIKELGVKIKLSDGVKDAVYSYNAPTTQTQTYATFGGSAYISTQTLTNKDAACSSERGPLGAIVKITGNTDGLGNTLVADNNTVFKLGDNFYRYEGPQTACSNDSSVNSLASEQIAALKEAFKTIQLDN